MEAPAVRTRGHGGADYFLVDSFVKAVARLEQLIGSYIIYSVTTIFTLFTVYNIFKKCSLLEINVHSYKLMFTLRN